MSFFRSYIAPLLIVLTFLIAMLAVSARIFLPSDMMAPAPIEEPVGQIPLTSGSKIAVTSENDISDVSWFLTGLPEEFYQG